MRRIFARVKQSGFWRLLTQPLSQSEEALCEYTDTLRQSRNYKRRLKELERELIRVRSIIRQNGSGISYKWDCQGCGDSVWEPVPPKLHIINGGFKQLCMDCSANAPTPPQAVSQIRPLRGDPDYASF